ncbi:hypothetical protein FHW96_002641 [Novosphingobium sp. SG751A]|uniref:hypothetical protein n=1 Tax=Novosphingobium sp. SG751A TaxID=2587000 RepID=UPI001557FB59|nr:hypothetical protein [Novosphingobium sp. SG751A]NOW46481.1 hypothetical protein [Novosphingobium sp. SG751A]
MKKTSLHHDMSLFLQNISPIKSNPFSILYTLYSDHVMTTSQDKTSRSFSAFTSAEDDARAYQLSSEQEEERNRGAERKELGAQPSEITMLERRVLAQERILRALIGHLADDNPDILARLSTRFGQGHNLGEHEQDFVFTDHYGEQFIRLIEKEIEDQRRR